MFTKFFTLNILHILNDGFKASLLLFLPFIAQEFHISLTGVGFLGSTINIFSVVLALPAGILAAKIGGYKTLLWALFFYAVGYLFTSISPHFYLIVTAFMLAGVGFALFHPVAFALIAKSSDKQSRGKILGNFTAIGDIGRIAIAGIITFVIAHIGWRYSSFGTFVFLLAILYVALITTRRQGNIHIESKAINTTGYMEILKHKKFLLVSLTDLIDSFASQSLFIFIPFLLLARGVKPEFLGILTSAYFVGSIIGKLVLGRLVDKLGSVKVFIFSEIIMALFLVILSQSALIPIIIASSIIIGIFSKGTGPIVVNMISEAADHHQNYEKAYGLNALLAGFGTGLAPFVFGSFADKWGISTVFLLSAVCALCAIVPAFLFNRMRHS